MHCLLKPSIGVVSCCINVLPYCNIYTLNRKTPQDHDTIMPQSYARRSSKPSLKTGHSHARQDSNSIASNNHTPTGISVYSLTTKVPAPESNSTDLTSRTSPSPGGKQWARHQRYTHLPELCRCPVGFRVAARHPSQISRGPQADTPARRF